MIRCGWHLMHASIFILRLKKVRPVVAMPCPSPHPHPQVYICVCLFRSELLSLLKTYNCYHEGRSFQLRHREVRPLTLCVCSTIIWLGLCGLLRCVSFASMVVVQPSPLSPSEPVWLLSNFLVRNQVTSRQGWGCPCEGF